MSQLILKRAPLDPDQNQDDFDVLADAAIIGRIFMVPNAPQDRPWMWASGPQQGHPVARRTAMKRRARR